MKNFAALLLLAGLAQHRPAVASSSPASPLLGTWTVDVARLPVPPAARPKRVTITFSDAGGGKWTTKVDIFGGDGSQRHMSSTYLLDGTASPIEGDTTEADVGAVKLPLANVMVMQLSRRGIPASTRVYTVSADRETMIETAAYVGEGGKPVFRTNYFSRLR